MKKPAKPKKVSYELIARDSVAGHPMYCLLGELVDLHHQELQQARIGLAWCTSWNPDVDGRVTLGKCKKASDLDRELAEFDFLILLRKSFWLDDRVSPLQRRALLDHELCHAGMKYDGAGEPVADERGRYVYRTKKHDLEEFTSIVERYGTWTSDIEAFAAALRRSGFQAFKPCEQCQGNPGWVEILDVNQAKRMTRCACWLRWSEQREAVREEQPKAAVSA